MGGSGKRKGSKQPPRYEELGLLGEDLRCLREAAGKTLSEVFGGKKTGYASRIENGHEQPTEKYLENWISLAPQSERPAIRERLKDKLAKAVAAKGRLKSRLKAQTPRSSPLRSFPRQTVRHTVQKHEVLHRLTGRSKTEMIVNRSIRAEVDDLKSIRAVFRHAADPQAVEIHALGGCRVENVHLSTNGKVVATLRLPRSLTRGERHSLSYRVSINTTAPSTPWATTIADMNELVEDVSIRVQFDDEELPVRAWWFVTENYWRLPGEPSPETELDIADGYVEMRFQNTRPDRHYTVAWLWAGDSVENKTITEF